MIYEVLRYLNRARRYREISNLIAPAITATSLERVEKTLQDAYQKAVAQGAKEGELKPFNQQLIDQVNELLARENGVRVRQWTEAILEAEEKFLKAG